MSRRFDTFINLAHFSLYFFIHFFSTVLDHGIKEVKIGTGEMVL